MQGGISTAHDIPPELWNAIIVLLPPLDRLSCLSVARMFHDIAVPLVFEHVHITYGISSDCTLFSDAVDPYTPLSPGSTETQERRARAARSTSEFLQHLAATPELAKMVRRFTVRAISLSPEDVDCADLVNALRATSHLQSFSWRGNSPYIPETAVDAIIESGAPLEELLIPLWNTAASSLSRLRNLRAITLDPDMRIEAPHEKVRIASSKENPKIIIAANAETLRSLSVFGAISRWRVPVESLVNLTEFECIWPDGKSGYIASVLDKCPQLRSLMLGISLVDLMEGAIITVLRSRAASVPQLTAFKVQMDVFSRPYTVAFVESLVVFLSNKRRLRRLDINISGIDEGIPGLDGDGCPLVHLLELLPTFPHIEVLGMNLSRIYFTMYDFNLLDRNIPLGLTALCLNLRIRQVLEPARPALFSDFFKKRDRLRYLHYINDSGRWILFDALKTMCPRTVELLGYNSKMYWTIPNADGENAVELTSQWSDMQLWFHTVDDFAGNEDWEWLIRHRNTDIMP